MNLAVSDERIDEPAQPRQRKAWRRLKGLTGNSVGKKSLRMPGLDCATNYDFSITIANSFHVSHRGFFIFERGFSLPRLHFLR